VQPVVTVTPNPAVDGFAEVDHVVPDRKLRCGIPEHDPGGGGINVARAIRELGGAAEALWSRGGHGGDRLATLLDRAGIAHRPVPVDGDTRTNLTVLEGTSGRHYRFVLPGPVLHGDDVGRWLTVIADLSPPPAYLVLSGSLPPGLPDDFYARLANATGDETRVIVDSSGEAVVRAVDAGVFLVKPNIRELGQIVGEELEDDAHVEAAARKLIDRGRTDVVVTSLGAGGAIVVTADHCAHVRSPTVPIRSRVGAGNSMVAALVLGLARGLGVHEAVRFGVAAGAAAAMTPGTRLCRREDADRLYERMRAEAARDPAVVDF